jgi:endonuclease/exonuclease/phosphatase (EEP) superfamily protein YafD
MTWSQRVTAAVAWAYLASLFGVIAALRFVGERWWITGVALYLPRFLFGTPLPFIVIALVVLRLRRLIWTQVVAAALFVFALLGFVPPWPTFSNRDAPALRLLSYNVNSLNGGLDGIVREIDDHSPDIVVIEEAANTEALRSALRPHYPTVEAAGQFVLATRYTLVSTTEPEKIEYEGKQRSPRFLRYVLDTPLGRIVLYGVHPLSPREALYGIRGEQGLRREILSGHLFSGANSVAFQANNGLRMLQAKAFSEAAQRETDPVIVAGDTNLPGLSWVLHRYLSDYQDGFARAGWGFGYTFPTAPRHPWMRIDRILAGRELKFVGFEVGTSLASDHHCVVADIQRR